ncbi:MAG: ATP-dependent DNA ligase [Verrucomicrobiota bacterium]
MGALATENEIPIRLEKGEACLDQIGLWLDPHRARPFAFVSHAHADHFAPHGRILCSRGTRAIAEARFSAKESEFLSLDFGVPIELEEHEITLLPAGHIPGSAMLHVRRLRDGASLLHTGDFKTRPALGAEQNEPRAADVLIMETTFGLPRFRFPSSDRVLDAMTSYAREALEEGEVPVFMAYSLGKAQEILLSLHERAPELAFQVHGSVAKMNEVVATLGYDLPPCEMFDPKERSPFGQVVVVPPMVGRSRAMRRLRKSVRLAMVSGWGMDSSAKYRYQCDEVFPLSDHAGYDDLLSFVDAVSPQKVFTIHGYREDFARTLRSRGYEAWPLVEVTQTEFLLDDARGSGPSPDPVEPKKERPESEFGCFVRICEQIAETTGKTKKQEILAAYLSETREENLAQIVAWLGARPFGRSEEIRAAHVGWAVIRQALLDLSGMTLAQYRRISSSQADAARTAYLVLDGKSRATPHSIEEIDGLFRDLAARRGSAEKVARLRESLATFHPSEAAIVIGILMGDLRIGLKEGLLEEAIAAAFDAPPSAVREAHMLTGDLGETAVLAREDRLDEAEATWFTPIKVMLASPEETAEDIVSRLGGEEESIWLEDKFDGIRAQLHRKGDRVELFSRDLRPLHKEFPELVEAGRTLDHDVILDGEIIAYADGRKLTFFDLQKRLGRRDRRLDQGDLFLGEAVPVRFIAFDLLGIDGAGFLDRPLSERREALDSIAWVESIGSCAVTRVRGSKAVDEAFNEARRRDNEGLIAKDPGSLYSPGRRGKQWLKLKKAMPTLDVVVVKAQQGHGKRSHVLSDYTFSVRDEAGGLRVIGKAYSGLTDEEIEELTEHFQSRTIEKNRGSHVVEPDIVLEIAFDSINASKRHDSGLALRFPRIKAIRRDKTLDEIDTLAYARKLAGVKS